MLRIAMTCSVGNDTNFVHPRYWHVLVKAGERLGMAVAPVILPLYTDDAYLRWCAENYDGLLFTGGTDLDPTTYGETNEKGLSADIIPDRDTVELTLGRYALQLGIPSLGICRGIQSMNVAAGGSLWQDIHSQICVHGKHCTVPEGSPTPRHDVTVRGALAEVLGQTEVNTNSYHHQAVKTVGPRMEILAHSWDGVVEAIAKKDHPYYVGIQWHPEIFPDHHSEKIFDWFVRAVAANKKN